MKVSTSVLCSFLVAASTCALAEGPETFQQVTLTATDHTDFAPGGTIRVEGSFGHVMVDGWDKPEVELTTVKSMPYGYDKARATQQLGRVQVKLERRSATELSISTATPSRRHFPFFSSAAGPVTIDYELHIPRESRVIVHHEGGYVMASQVNGEIEATNPRGDIVLMLPDPGPYSIDAKSKFGAVQSDFEGQSHLVHLIGDRFANSAVSPSRRVYVRVGVGGVTIKELPAASVTPGSK